MGFNNTWYVPEILFVNLEKNCFLYNISEHPLRTAASELSRWLTLKPVLQALRPPPPPPAAPHSPTKEKIILPLYDLFECLLLQGGLF
jgi:hypothetical protein